jgi:group I intron endonuclease
MCKTFTNSRFIDIIELRRIGLLIGHFLSGFCFHRFVAEKGRKAEPLKECPIFILEENMDNNVGIYEIVNLVNGKKYVGRSIKLDKRKARHFRELRENRHGLRNKNGILKGERDHLQRAFNKYGEEAFEWRILEYCEKEYIVEREQYYIDLYHAADFEYGYNINPRADKNPVQKKKHSEETKELMRIKATNRKHTPETKEKLRKIKTGQKHTKETKKKLSEMGKGRVFSEEHKEKLRKPNSNKGLTHEGVRKRKKTLLIKNNGQYFSKESINKMRSNQPKFRKNIQKDTNQTNQPPVKYKHLVGEWRELRNNGYTNSYISKIFGVNERSIRKYLNEFYPEENSKLEKRWAEEPVLKPQMATFKHADMWLQGDLFTEVAA